ncbi:hypothetical protein ACJX0J_014390, partial [Zea mays]
EMKNEHPHFLGTEPGFVVPYAQDSGTVDMKKKEGGRRLHVGSPADLVVVL